MLNLPGIFKYNEKEIDDEIEMTQNALNETLRDCRRLQCLLQLLKDEKEKIKNEKI